MDIPHPMSGPEMAQVHSDPTHPYAFLVHSQSTLDHDLPPKVDSQTLTRQKRRRTSPEDHTILEAEYQTNSKPDKAARAEIVKKVSLEEKAVQIWFQNRRQNDRRKSRPLLPHELIPHLRNPPPGSFQTHHALSYDSSMSPFPIHHTETQAVQTTSSPGNTSPSLPSPVGERAPSRGSSIHDLLNPVHEPIESKVPNASSSSEVPTSPLSGSDASNSINASTQTMGQEIGGTKGKQPSVAEQGSQSKKRAFHDMDTTVNVSSRVGTPASTASSQDKSSSVRLSMSLDGAVRVKTTEEETPSPPKQRPVAPNPDLKRVGGLQRSKSEVGLNEASVEGLKVQIKQAGGTFGRSRDARTWEFFCDSDMRDALATQAERERSGSAVGAISLIRSQSKKSRENLREQQRREALHPKTSVINVQKTASSLVSKPKLSRTQSSMGRLQHDHDLAPKQDPKSAQPLKSKLGKPSHTRTASGDSDKENWAPGTRASGHPLRRAHTSTNTNTHNILNESSAPQETGSNVINSKRVRTTKRVITLYDEAVDDKEGNNDTTHAHPAAVSYQTSSSRSDGDEIAAFMISSRRSTDESSTNSKEKDEDMDCIQGLLSLSQGAWR